MTNATKIIGKKACIISDNDNYDAFRDNVLIITHASRDGMAYDSSMYPELLCDFEILDNPKTEFPFALYEYEFKLL